jgi:hypothetical protein
MAVPGAIAVAGGLTGTVPATLAGAVPLGRSGTGGPVGRHDGDPADVCRFSLAHRTSRGLLPGIHDWACGMAASRRAGGIAG